MVFPFSRQGLVVKAFDQPKARRPGEHSNVLPLLVALKDLARHTVELSIHSAVFLDAPHSALWLYHL